MHKMINIGNIGPFYPNNIQINQQNGAAPIPITKPIIMQEKIVKLENGAHLIIQPDIERRIADIVINRVELISLIM